MKTTVCTGYWTFFCNPTIWHINEILNHKSKQGYYSITWWQRHWFEPNQLGVIRVGVDRRSTRSLDGETRLYPGIYAIVKILGKSRQRTKEEITNWDRNDEAPSLNDPKAFVVDIEYIDILLERPVLLTQLRNNINDKYLLSGFQSASMPLGKESFETVLRLIRQSKPAPLHSTEVDPDLAAFEGENKRYFITHRKREWKFRAAKIDNVISMTGQLCCEVPGCRFDFAKVYGNLGMHYAHVHHEKPLSMRDTSTATILHELRIVCANCHAIIHRHGRNRSLEDIGEAMSLTASRGKT